MSATRHTTRADLDAAIAHVLALALVEDYRADLARDAAAGQARPDDPPRTDNGPADVGASNRSSSAALRVAGERASS